MVKCIAEFFFTVFSKNRNISPKIKRSKVTDYAALIDGVLSLCFAYGVKITVIRRVQISDMTLGSKVEVKYTSILYYGLLEPTIFFNLYTKSPYNSGSESPWRKRDLRPIWNLDIKS